MAHNIPGFTSPFTGLAGTELLDDMTLKYERERDRAKELQGDLDALKRKEKQG